MSLPVFLANQAARSGPCDPRGRDVLLHSAHLGHFRRLPPPSEIRLGRNGQFWDICDAARMNTGVNRQAEGRHSAR